MALSDWEMLCAAACSADRASKRRGRRMAYSGQQIVKMLLWTIRHDRPLCWGCDRASYAGGVYRPKQLTSVSQLCRQAQSPRVVAMLEHISRRLGRPARPVSVWWGTGCWLLAAGVKRLINHPACLFMPRRYQNFALSSG